MKTIDVDKYLAWAEKVGEYRAIQILQRFLSHETEEAEMRLVVQADRQAEGSE